MFDCVRQQFPNLFCHNVPIYANASQDFEVIAAEH